MQKNQIEKTDKGKKVTIIPATLQRYTFVPVAEQETRKRKVAAYARVSTNHLEQVTSYEAQIDYYTNYIKKRSDWEFVRLYSDEGITGTSTKRRMGFQQMVADALDGKIELILTKSVSRFARNTVDSLTTIRRLKEHGVECYFEKENIWTFDSKGELLLTIMSSLAQEESRSISENTLWGMRKSFQDGKAFVPFKHFLGYDRGPNGELVVNEEQAETVRLIYKLYLDGFSYYAIARNLTQQKIKTPYGYDVWNGSTVRNILKNEKYKGDALLQKRYTEDFLSKKMRVNQGEVPQYYVKDDHEAIIEPELFEQVQREIKRRAAMTGKYSGSSIYSTKIQCGDCGGWYGPVVWHSTDKYRRIVWRCNHKYKIKGKKNCGTPHLTEEEIQQAFLSAINRLNPENSRQLAEFNEELWIKSVDHMTVYQKKEIRVWFRDGREVLEKL